jgi:hypothetical protein
MEDSSKASVLVKMCDFLKVLIPHIDKYPLDQRFILGTRTTPRFDNFSKVVKSGALDWHLYKKAVEQSVKGA